MLGQGEEIACLAKCEREETASDARSRLSVHPARRAAQRGAARCGAVRIDAATTTGSPAYMGNPPERIDGAVALMRRSGPPPPLPPPPLPSFRLCCTNALRECLPS